MILISFLFTLMTLAKGIAMNTAPLIQDWKPYESVVAIELIRPDGSLDYCSGLLIQPKVILTNAHCIDSYGLHDQKKSSVVYGDSAVKPKSKRVQIQRWIQHPEYRKDRQQKDFALGFLAEAITQHPFTVLKTFSLPKDQTPIIRFGFGKRNNENRRTAQSVFYDGIQNQGPIKGLIRFRDALGVPGDSGGGVFIGKSAIGLHTGRSVSDTKEVLDYSNMAPFTYDVLNWIQSQTLQTAPKKSKLPQQTVSP